MKVHKFRPAVGHVCTPALGHYHGQRCEYLWKKVTCKRCLSKKPKEGGK